MSEDLDAILQYIDQPDADYALMLTGPWGCGKTHFWKHAVLPVLSTRGDLRSRPFPVYVSLYGVKRPDDIRNAVLAQLHPSLHTLGNWASVLGPALMRWMKIELPDDATLADFLRKVAEGDEKARGALEWLRDRLGGKRRLIICFDDLERCSMEMELALGHINQYVEHGRAKVVVICNEEEIRPEHRELYRRTKEKIVRVTRTLTLDPIRILAALIAEFSSDLPFHGYLVTHREMVTPIILQSDFKNVRSLKYAMMMLRTAFHVINEYSSTNPALLPAAIQTLLPVILDMESHRLPAKDARQLLLHGSGAILGAYMSVKDGEQKPIAEFGKRYGLGGIDSNLIVSAALADFIATGYLDRTRMRAEIEARNIAESPGKVAIEKLTSGWFLLDDADARSATEEAIQAIRAGEIEDWNRLLDAAGILDWMRREGAIAVSPEFLKVAFDEGIESLVSRGRFAQSDPLFHYRDRDPHGLDATSELRRHVRQSLLTRNDSLTDATLRAAVQDALCRLVSDDDGFSVMMWNDHGQHFSDRPFGVFVSPEQFVTAIVKASNAACHSTARALTYRYNESHRLAKLVDDIPWLEEVNRRLGSHLAQLDDSKPIRRLNLTGLQRRVVDAIVLLRQGESHASAKQDDRLRDSP